MSSVAIALSELRPGQTGKILEYLGAQELHLRLMELGMLPGTEVRCLRLAPFGDPLEVEVRGCCLSLRKAEAATITVEPL